MINAQKKIGLILFNKGKILLSKAGIPLLDLDYQKSPEMQINGFLRECFNGFNFIKKIDLNPTSNSLVDNYVVLDPISMVPNSMIKKKGFLWKKFDFDTSDLDPALKEAIRNYLISPKIILVSGTPGTGKTTFAKELSLLIRAKHIDVKKLVEKHKIGRYNDRLDTLDVDVDRLTGIMEDMVKKAKIERKTLIFDSLLSHYLSSKWADMCVITTCSDISTLKGRLEARGYDPVKVRDNLDSEIFQVCKVEALESGHNVCVIDTIKKSAISGFISRYNPLFHDI